MEKAWFLAGLMHFSAQDTLGRDLLAYYGVPHMLLLLLVYLYLLLFFMSLLHYPHCIFGMQH
jgi:hypothetical protein